ncbi:MAG TPA: AMIN domain-containing protein [Gemmatimonadales bacterium]|nr:AMIN domain-containing protein [Gemmatimonadales bacterium]HRZ08265.1 AMIN domain-containing protein [Gemmatimonadales bacterium]
MTRVLTCALAVALMGLAAPARADVSDPGSVTGVSVVSAPGRAEVVIAISGAVQLKDFILKDPARLVLDLTGTTLDSRALGLYDGVNRGGVLNVRTGQYSAQVVRVVVELDAVKDYTIDQSAGEIRISFGAERPFLAWSSAAPGEFSAPAARPASARPGGAPEVTTASYKAAAPGDEPRITVTWDNASIADVVAGFAAFSGRSIILGRDIKGEVSAEIKNQPWTEAFYAVLATQGLSATELPGGIIRVDSPVALSALDSLEPLETIVVRMNYARAKEMSKNLDGILTKGRGKVFPDTASNSLIITDTRSRIQNIAAFTRGLDIRTPQVAIQAKIIFVNRTSLEELGLKYDLGSQSTFYNSVVQRPDPANPGDSYDPGTTVVGLGGNSLAAVGNPEASISQPALDLVWSTAIGNFDFTVFLSALEQTELADIQAEPTINTMDNREANILVGEETPVRVIDYGSGTVAAQSTVQFKQTGIKLVVTPHVTDDRHIAMKLHTERSAVRPVADRELGFIVETQQADNQLLVADGQTAVIGGLTVTEVLKTRSGIPMLSRLPLLGPLFSFSSNRETRKDLIILVTPRILDDNF